MDVYVVPVGVDRYELYCEVAETPDVDADAPRGILRRLRRRFREMMVAAELARRDSGGPASEPARPTRRWAGRLRDRALRWVAEAIAEQRLLWHLRRQATATLVYPEDLTELQARECMRARLRRDYDRHRFWAAIDLVAFVVSGIFVLLPGPNLVAYYFAFRLVGHYLSMRGARQGLDIILWDPLPSGPLAELRQALRLDPSQREHRVNEVASRLRLQHLASFFKRTVVATARSPGVRSG